MEGPSLVLLVEQLKPFTKKKILAAQGVAPVNLEMIANGSLKAVKSWGKHLLLVFDKTIIRIHFLMFGSYRINATIERDPKLSLKFAEGTVNFYSCAVKEISKEDFKAYDWTIDLMAKEWDEKIVVKRLRSQPNAMICDLLMDQDIFPGLGNIIKNEVLYLRRQQPEVRLKELSAKEQLALVRESRNYCFQFYEWKKIDQLKRNWKIFRKRKCPECRGDLSIRKTGFGQRVSFFCTNCQLGTNLPLPEIKIKPSKARQWVRAPRKPAAEQRV